MTAPIYDFEAESISGKTVKLSEYEGKPMLIVNTASKCGLTPQYEGLEKLYEEYKDQGLVVLGFPCNQFAGQEPGSESDIEEFCQLNYGVTFPMFSKIDVNGRKTHSRDLHQLIYLDPLRGKSNHCYSVSYKIRNIL
jgi:glutathione peroxidase